MRRAAGVRSAAGTDGGAVKGAVLPRGGGLPWLGRGWVWGLVPWLLVARVAITAPELVWQDDVFLHVRMGLSLLAGQGLGGDPAWTFGPADPSFATPMPASQVAMALAYQWFGWAGIGAGMVLMQACLVAGLWLGLALVAPGSARLSPGPVRVACILLVAGWAAILADNLALMQRPQVVSLALMPVVGAWVVRGAISGRFPAPWWVLALVVPWAWVHGYVLLVAPGLVLAWVVFVVGSGSRWRAGARRSWRAASLAVGAAVLGTLCTPLGPEIYAVAWRMREAAGGLLTEWGAPALGDASTLALMVLAASWVVIAAGCTRGWFGGRAQVGVRALAREAMVVAAFFVFGLSAKRAVAAGIVLLVVVVGYRAMRAWGQVPARDWERLAGWRGQLAVGAARCAAVAAVAAVMVSWIAGHPGVQGLDRGRVPVDLLAQVAAQSAAQDRLIIADWSFASATGFLLPDARLAVDGRTERYGPRGAADLQVGLLGAQPGWPVLLSRYGQARMLLVSESQPLVQVLMRYGWVVRGRWVPSDYREPVVWLVPGPGALSLAEIAARES